MWFPLHQTSPHWELSGVEKQQQPRYPSAAAAALRAVRQHRGWACSSGQTHTINTLRDPVPRIPTHVSPLCTAHLDAPAAFYACGWSREASALRTVRKFNFATSVNQFCSFFVAWIRLLIMLIRMQDLHRKYYITCINQSPHYGRYLCVSFWFFYARNINESLCDLQVQASAFFCSQGLKRQQM